MNDDRRKSIKEISKEIEYSKRNLEPLRQSKDEMLYYRMRCKFDSLGDLCKKIDKVKNEEFYCYQSLGDYYLQSRVHVYMPAHYHFMILVEESLKKLESIMQRVKDEEKASQQQLEDIFVNLNSILENLKKAAKK